MNHKIIQQFNENVITIAVDKILTNKDVFFWFGEPADDTSPYTKKLVADITRVHGVSRVLALSKYSITIEKGSLFEWGDITQKLLHILWGF